MFITDSDLDVVSRHTGNYGTQTKQKEDSRARQAYHKQMPSEEKLKKPEVEVVQMIKVEDPAEEGQTEEEKKRKKRENSFVRDGFEIYFEGTYIVNGRRKKKIKKRKLSKV